MDENDIRKELAKTLADEPSNYSRILELSSKLASFDTDNVGFSVDAGVIDRLGTELVARQETAVSELVKNSYDADAKIATLKFENSDSIGGTLIIDDNGLGMTKEQLVNGFMRISSTDKLHNPLSERYNRKRAGQKGIGRFAVQRLGEKLTITTQTLEDDFALVLTIDWNKSQGDIDLVNITNKIITVPKRKEEGTTLRIEGLKDKWTQAAIKRIYRYVSAIIQPFPLSEQVYDIASIDKSVDPGFKTVFKKLDNDKSIIIADESKMIYDHALAEIEGWIDSNGLGIYLSSFTTLLM
jgi:hypothetical protein